LLDAIPTPGPPIWNFIDSIIPDGENLLPSAPFTFLPMPLIEIYDKFVRRIILASLFCGSGRVYKVS